jgi:hypothetical protein
MAGKTSLDDNMAGPTAGTPQQHPPKTVYKESIFKTEDHSSTEVDTRRKHPSHRNLDNEVSSTTMSGKQLIFILALMAIPLTLANNNGYKQGEVRGGLLFEKDVEKPVIVNPNYISYTRKVLLSDIFRAVDLTQQFTSQYKRFCTSVKEAQNAKIMVRSYSYKHKYMYINEFTKIIDAWSHCHRKGYTLPEVRTWTDARDLKLFAKDNNIFNINVNTYWNRETKRVQYHSDNLPVNDVLDKMYITNGSNVEPFVAHKYDPLAIPYWEEGAYSYISLINDSWFLRNVPGTVLKEGIMERPVCLVTNTPFVEKDHSYLQDIAAHLCERDYKLLKGMTSVVAREASLFESKVDIGKEIKEMPTVEGCASIKTFDKDKIYLLKAEIERVGQIIAARIGFPAEIGQKWATFKALGLQTLTEFKHFLRSDISHTYLHQNPTEQLLNTLSCMLDIDQGFSPKDVADEDYSKFKLYDFDKELENVHRIVSMTTQHYERTHLRNKRQLQHTVTIDRKPDSSHLFSTANFGHILGLGTVKDIVRAWEHIAANSKALGDLAVNQAEIARGYGDLRDELRTLQNATSQTENGIVSITTVLDNKQAVLQLHNIIRQSLLIIHTAVSAAENGKVSPYVLSENELDTMAKELRNQNIFLTNNLNDIDTQVYKIQNEFGFVFSIPIIDNKYLFKIFHVRNFPIFDINEGTQIVNHDAEYLGISVDNTNYIELTSTEYTECIDQTFCKVTGIRAPITDHSSCAIRSYKHKIQICPATRSNITLAFFVTYANNTIYSTPKGFKGDLLCPKLNAREDGEPTQGRLTFDGVGSMHLQRNCHVELEDKRIIQAQFNAYKSFELGLATVSEAFKFIPSIENYTFQGKYEDIFENHDIPDLILRNISNTLTPIDIIKVAVSPNEVLPHIIRFVLIMGTAVVVFLVLYATVEPFRQWFKACCFVNNPKKYWTKKGYSIPDFERIPPDAVCTEDLPDPNNPTNTLLPTNNTAGTGQTNDDANDQGPTGNMTTFKPMDRTNEDYIPMGHKEGLRPILKKPHLSKARIDDIMSKRLTNYKDALVDRQDREMEMQRQVLAKRVECENAYVPYDPARDDQNRPIPHRPAPAVPMPKGNEPPTTYPHPINMLPFPNNIPRPIPDEKIRTMAERLGKKLRFQEPQD